MRHGAFLELAAGAALDDLDSSEADRLSDHLGACPPCRRSVTALADVAGLMALAAPRRRPPATLKHDVLAALARGVPGQARPR
jgi:predicted anti-sigma-YlaC factor YlaD